MSSSYTGNLKLEKQGSGENTGSWGTGHLNPKMIDMVDEAVSGVQQVDISGGDVVLVIPNGSTGNGRCAIIELIGNITGNDRLVTMPAFSKVTVFINTTTQGAADTVMVKVSGGSNEILIPNGAIRQIISDGVEAAQVDEDQALIGRQTFPILAQAMTPLTTNGASPIQTELAAGNPEIVGLSFSGTVAQGAQFCFPMPKAWDKGTVTFEVHWTSITTGTNGVYFAIAGLAAGDGDAINSAYGAAVTITDVAQSATNKKYKTAETAAMTFGGTPLDGDMLWVKLVRDPTQASDTIAEAVTVLELTMFYKTDVGNDA